MARGKPVVAYAGGGALETVVPGVTGTLFDAQTPESLAAALEGFERGRFAAGAIRRHAERFDSALFRRRLRDIVSAAHRAYREGVPSFEGSRGPAGGAGPRPPPPPPPGPGGPPPRPAGRL